MAGIRHKMKLHEFINKHKPTITAIGRNIFLIMVLLMVVDFTGLLSVKKFLNIEILFAVGIFFGTISFLLWNKKRDNKKTKSMLKYSLVIIMVLFILANINFTNPNNFFIMISHLRSYLFVLATALAFLNFKQNDVLRLNISNEREREIFGEKKREFLIRNKHTKNIPIITPILRKIYKHGILYVLVLILIMIAFVAIRYPYLDISFTGVHNLKYSTFVEPARNMLEKGPLWYELQYTSTPFFDGVYSRFPNYPLMEWGLYEMYSTFPDNTVEYNTRIFITLLGIIILLFVYLTLIKFLSKKHSLIILALLSTSYIFQLFTFVTVMDVFIILFLFISLYFFLKSIDENNLKMLFISGIIAGIGVNTKYSAILFYIPIFLTFLFLYKKMHEERRITYLILFVPSLIIQTIIFRLSLANLPLKPLFSFTLFLFFIMLHILIYLDLDKLSKIIGHFVKIIGYRKVYFTMAASSIIILFTVLRIDWVNQLTGQFLTNKDFLFNWTQYNIFFDEVQRLLTNPLYIIALMCMISMLFLPSKRIRLILYAFFSGAAIYFILASRAIYPHEYYTHIIVFTFILFAGCLYLFAYIFETEIAQYVVFALLIALFVFSIYPSSHKVVDFYLSREKPAIKDVSIYLNEHVSNDEIILLGDDVDEAVALYANRKSFIEYYAFRKGNYITPQFKSEIASGDNLSTIMKRYSIKYYVSRSKEESTYPGLVYLFFDESEPYICSDNIPCTQDRRLKEIGHTIFKENIQPYMIFETEISGYYISKFYD